jgi:hypothetical protein
MRRSSPTCHDGRAFRGRCRRSSTGEPAPPSAPSPNRQTPPARLPALYRLISFITDGRRPHMGRSAAKVTCRPPRHPSWWSGTHSPSTSYLTRAPDTSSTTREHSISTDARTPRQRFSAGSQPGERRSRIEKLPAAASRAPLRTRRPAPPLRRWKTGTCDRGDSRRYSSTNQKRLQRNHGHRFY